MQPISPGSGCCLRQKRPIISTSMKAASTMLMNRSAPLRCLARVAVDNWSSTTQSRQHSILEHRQKPRGPPHETRALHIKIIPSAACYIACGPKRMRPSMRAAARQPKDVIAGGTYRPNDCKSTAQFAIRNSQILVRTNRTKTRTPHKSP